MDEKGLYFFRNDDYFVPLPGVKEGVFVISLKLVPAIGDVHERGQGRGSRSTMIIGKRHRGRVKWSFRIGERTVRYLSRFPFVVYCLV